MYIQLGRFMLSYHRIAIYQMLLFKQHLDVVPVYVATKKRQDFIAFAPFTLEV